MPTITEWLGFACFGVLVLFVIMGWRSGKRQFRAWSDMCRLEGRNQLAAELTAAAAGGSAAASQTVMVVQGDNARTRHSTDDSGRQPGRVLDGVPAHVHGADLPSADLAALCERYGIDPVEVYRQASLLQASGGPDPWVAVASQIGPGDGE